MKTQFEQYIDLAEKVNKIDSAYVMAYVAEVIADMLLDEEINIRELKTLGDLLDRASRVSQAWDARRENIIRQLALEKMSADEAEFLDPLDWALKRERGK